MPLDRQGIPLTCELCFEEKPGEGWTRLPCGPTPHVFHTRCVEREIRYTRRRDGPTVTIKCPCCEHVVVVGNIPGLEEIRTTPVPQKGVREHLQRRIRNGMTVYSVLDDLAEDILRKTYPPYFPPENWSIVVEYVRSLDRCNARDDEAYPVLSRDATFRFALERWAAEVHRGGRGSQVQDLPLPAGRGVAPDAVPRSPIPTTLRQVRVRTAFVFSLVAEYTSSRCISDVRTFYTYIG